MYYEGSFTIEFWATIKYRLRLSFFKASLLL